MRFCVSICVVLQSSSQFFALTPSLRSQLLPFPLQTIRHLFLKIFFTFFKLFLHLPAIFLQPPLLFLEGLILLLQLRISQLATLSKLILLFPGSLFPPRNSFEVGRDVGFSRGQRISSFLEFALLRSLLLPDLILALQKLCLQFFSLLVELFLEFFELLLLTSEVTLFFRILALQLFQLPVSLRTQLRRVPLLQPRCLFCELLLTAFVLTNSILSQLFSCTACSVPSSFAPQSPILP